MSFYALARNVMARVAEIGAPQTPVIEVTD